MSKFKENWTDGLTEDLFQIHEEILDENSLFQFHILCDKIMNDNPRAKHDGGFKVITFVIFPSTLHLLSHFNRIFEVAMH